jgi:hypothetical protein
VGNNWVSRRGLRALRNHVALDRLALNADYYYCSDA